MFGERLRKLREEKGMTQNELASFLNVTRTSISAYENNANDPSLDSLVKIADLFNVSLDYLLGRTEEQSSYNLLDKTDKYLLSLNKSDKYLISQLHLVIKNHKTKK